MNNTQWTFDELMKLSEERYASHDEYRQSAQKAQREAVEFQSQAVELVAPFKRGDVVEYFDTFGYSGKKRIVRLIVERYHSINPLYFHVSGIVLKKGTFEKTRMSKGFRYEIGTDTQSQFIKIVEKEKEKNG